jgi:hypothetical protein
MIKALQQHEIKYLDASGFSCFNRCPAKYYFSRLLGLGVRGARMIAPDYGTCIHAALPFCYNMQTVELGIQEFNKLWDDYGYGETDPKRNKKRAKDMLLHFASKRAGAQCPYEIVKFPMIQAPNGCKKVSDTEIPFLIDIGACYPLAGRIDLAIKWNLDGQLWPADYKTTSELSPRLSESFWNSPQACAYTIAMQHLTGKPAPGLMVEAIRVSPVNDEIALYPVHILPHLLDNFSHEFAVVTDTIQTCNNVQLWTQKPSGCASYAMYGFPGSECEYKALCNSPDWTDIEPLYEHRAVYHPFDMNGAV